MANPEHVDILRQGVEVWNKWRDKYPNVIPDLMNAYLVDANLSYLNLRGANLRGANLSHASLIDSNRKVFTFRHVRPIDTDHSEAYLVDANLRSADLRGADLKGANLSHASLINVDLIRSYLMGANLREADLSLARVGWTVFGNLDLRTVKGLETINHRGPSSIGIDTIYRSGGNIPEAFLRGAGIDNTFISYIRSLVDKPIKYNSCFISYSSEDDDFAERLYADLQSKNVCCWYASPRHEDWR